MRARGTSRLPERPPLQTAAGVFLALRGFEQGPPGHPVTQRPSTRPMPSAFAPHGLQRHPSPLASPRPPAVRRGGQGVAARHLQELSWATIQSVPERGHPSAAGRGMRRPRTHTASGSPARSRVVGDVECHTGAAGFDPAGGWCSGARGKRTRAVARTAKSMVGRMVGWRRARPWHARQPGAQQVLAVAAASGAGQQQRTYSAAGIVPAKVHGLAHQGQDCRPSTCAASTSTPMRSAPLFQHADVGPSTPAIKRCNMVRKDLGKAVQQHGTLPVPVDSLLVRRARHRSMTVPPAPAGAADGASPRIPA